MRRASKQLFSALFLFYFLLQISKFRSIKKFYQSAPQAIAQHFQRNYTWILTFTVKNVFD